MATFKEIYNKRRTRTIKVTTTHEERQDITPRAVVVRMMTLSHSY